MLLKLNLVPGCKEVQMGREEQVLCAVQRPEISQELRAQIRWWDRFLVENGREAMLPGTLRGTREVSQKVKHDFNRGFRDFRLTCQRQRIVRKSFLVEKSSVRHGLYYDQYAIGTADDINHIPFTWEVGFYPRIYDISGVARRNGRRRYRFFRGKYTELDLPEVDQVILFGDVVANSRLSGDCDLMENTIFVDISRLLHHLKPSVLRDTMQNFGRLFVRPYRELLITIPRASENPDYGYKTSYPVDVGPILEWVQFGAKKDLVAEIVGRHHFCERQWYTTFVIMDPRDHIPS